MFEELRKWKRFALYSESRSTIQLINMPCSSKRYSAFFHLKLFIILVIARHRQPLYLVHHPDRSPSLAAIPRQNPIHQATEI